MACRKTGACTPGSCSIRPDSAKFRHLTAKGIAVMVDDRPEETGSLPDQERPKRAPPTIDLEATAVSTATPHADEAARSEPTAESTAEPAAEPTSEAPVTPPTA